MSKKRWFRFHIERWLDGTFGMTPNEIATYITVLCELYKNDGIVIRPEFDIMARRCGMRPSSFRKALDTLSRRGKLSLDGDVLTSKAVSEEIKSREKLDENSAESRQNLAEKRKQIKEIQDKLPSNKEERIQNKITVEGSALSPKTGARQQASSKSSSLEGFIKRREMFRRVGS